MKTIIAWLLLACTAFATDVSVTASAVARVTGGGPSTDTVIRSGFAGATITAGQSVYIDTTAGTWKLTDANLSAAAGVAQGIALNGASSGQPISIAVGGTLTPGFSVTIGKIYVTSANAGGIAPVEDLASGWRTGVLCVGLTGTTVGLVMYSSGVAVP